MTLSDVYDLLVATDLPVAYHRFTEEYMATNQVTLPYIVYDNSYDDNLSADNLVYHVSRHITVDLYEAARDATTEGTVETALSKIYYTKTETYLDDEQVYVITYEFEV